MAGAREQSKTTTTTTITCEVLIETTFIKLSANHIKLTLFQFGGCICSAECVDEDSTALKT
jgi:hypothetical protein